MLLLGVRHILCRRGARVLERVSAPLSKRERSRAPKVAARPRAGARDVISTPGRNGANGVSAGMRGGSRGCCTSAMSWGKVTGGPGGASGPGVRLAFTSGCGRSVSPVAGTAVQRVVVCGAALLSAVVFCTSDVASAALVSSVVIRAG